MLKVVRGGATIRACSQRPSLLPRPLRSQSSWWEHGVETSKNCGSVLMRRSYPPRSSMISYVKNKNLMPYSLAPVSMLMSTALNSSALKQTWSKRSLLSTRTPSSSSLPASQSPSPGFPMKLRPSYNSSILPKKVVMLWQTFFSDPTTPPGSSLFLFPVTSEPALHSTIISRAVDLSTQVRYMKTGR